MIKYLEFLKGSAFYMSGNDKEKFEPDFWSQVGFFDHHAFHHNHGRFYNYGHFKNHYEPWYDDSSDFNTNAKDYYDYLARFGKWAHVVEDVINRLLRRNLEVDDTNSIDMTKIGDWIDNGVCHGFDDVIHIKADVIVSPDVDERTFNNFDPKTVKIPNGTVVRKNGVWSPDYINALNAIDKEIGNLIKIINDQGDEINNLINNIKKIEQTLQKIIDNLYNSGAITTNNIYTFNFNPDRNIATGNINHFSGVAGGTHFIRTRKGVADYDVTTGI